MSKFVIKKIKLINEVQFANEQAYFYGPLKAVFGFVSLTPSMTYGKSHGLNTENESTTGNQEKSGRIPRTLLFCPGY